MKINTKSEALELHELSSEVLDAVSGGDKSKGGGKSNALDEGKAREGYYQMQAIRMYRQMVESAL